MDILHLILEILILLGVFFISFVQGKTISIQNQLLGFLKDYPDVAEEYINWQTKILKQKYKKKGLEPNPENIRLFVESIRAKIGKIKKHRKN